MDNKQKLEVLYKMLTDFEEVANKRPETDKDGNYATFGFCYYLGSNYELCDNTFSYIITELKKDLNIIPVHDYTMWYKGFDSEKFFYKHTCYKRIVTQQIQPRIDHLKRTIARLENELKEV